MVRGVEDHDAGQNDAGYRFPCLVEGGGKKQPESGKKGRTSPQQLEDIEKQSFEQAYQASIDEILAERKDIVDRAGSVVARQKAAWQSMQQSLEHKVSRAVAGAALELARIMIRRAVESNPELVRNVVSRALEMVVAKSDIVIKTNPQDWQVVKEAVETRQMDAGSHDRIEVESDGSIERGGCIIETEYGIIDARINSQIEVIRRALEG